MKIHQFSAHEIREKVEKNELTCRQVVEAALERIHFVENDLQAIISLDEDRAMARAVKFDQKAAGKESIGPLGGIPIIVKDNIVTTDLPTTCGSKILENFDSPYNATAVNRLLEADAIIIGKANMDEFAMGSSTENSAFGPTKNPWDLTKTPGGSSGGSVVAVAAGEAVLGLGSDTGGSVRQPASFCNTVGVKPTYGRVSRYGLVAFASSLDQIGAIAKDVEDAAMLLRVIAGRDPHDSTSASMPVPDYARLLDGPIKGMRIGIPREYFAEGIDTEVERTIRTALEVFKDSGAILIDINLKHTAYTIPTYYIINTAEASSNLARYDGVKYGLRQPGLTDLTEMYTATREAGFGPEVKRRIMLGTYVLSAGYYDAYYKKAQQVRTLIKEDFEAAWQKCDIIMAPTTPTTAFGLGEKTDDPLLMYLSDIYTCSANLAGLPAMSLPCGFIDGLPVGIQIIAPAYKEEIMFKAGYAYQQATDWHNRFPA